MFGSKAGGRSEKRGMMSDLKKNTTRKQRRVVIKSNKQDQRK